LAQILSQPPPYRDDAKIIENLVAIMEGGREAFRARKRRSCLSG